MCKASHSQEHYAQFAFVHIFISCSGSGYKPKQMYNMLLHESFNSVDLQGGLSVDSISDLVESQSRLLEALQLSHPAELELKKSPGGSSAEGRTQTKLSLNPIYRQVPQVLERCCSHIENHGELQGLNCAILSPPPQKKKTQYLNLEAANAEVCHKVVH